MPNFRGWEILVLIALLVLLFGARKLPDAARGIGRSLRIFKAETKGLYDDDKKSVTDGDEPKAVRDAPASADSSAEPVTGEIVEEQKSQSPGSASS